MVTRKVPAACYTTMFIHRDIEIASIRSSEQHIDCTSSLLLRNCYRGRAQIISPPSEHGVGGQ